ncbi:unnamed protein product, partial [Prorocentrum cordatum]
SISAGMVYIGLCFGVQTSLSSLQNVFVTFKSFDLIPRQCAALLDRGAKYTSHARTLQLLAERDHESNDHILTREAAPPAASGGAVAWAARPRPLREPSLDLRGVHLWVPGKIQQLVLSDFSVQLQPGESMLLVGETGVGKSLLLRAINGLWSHGCGTVVRCDRRSVACVPQRPFVFMGTLRDNLVYPDLEGSSDIETDRILEVLETVGLRHFVESVGLDSEGQWQAVLSLGQQQRLGAARELLRRGVRLALLDEATSALDLGNER